MLPLIKGWEESRDLHPFSQSSILLLLQSAILLRKLPFFFFSSLSLLLFHVLFVAALTFKDSHFTNDYETPPLVKEGSYPFINQFQANFDYTHDVF